MDSGHSLHSALLSAAFEALLVLSSGSTLLTALKLQNPLGRAFWAAALAVIMVAASLGFVRYIQLAAPAGPWAQLRVSHMHEWLSRLASVGTMWGLPAGAWEVHNGPLSRGTLVVGVPVALALSAAVLSGWDVLAVHAPCILGLVAAAGCSPVAGARAPLLTGTVAFVLGGEAGRLPCAALGLRRDDVLHLLLACGMRAYGTALEAAIAAGADVIGGKES